MSALPGLQRQLCHVFHMHRLQAIISRSGDSEEGEAPQQVGDIIDQYIFQTEDHRRSQDGIGDTRLAEHLFQLRLAAVIG